MMDKVKKLLKTRSSQPGLFIMSNSRDSSYVYVCNTDKKILFTSTNDCIRLNTLFELAGLDEILEDFAKKLGRRYVKAEFPDNFLINKRIREVPGNWDVRVLNPTLRTLTDAIESISQTQNAQQQMLSRLASPINGDMTGGSNIFWR